MPFVRPLHWVGFGSVLLKLSAFYRGWCWGWAGGGHQAQLSSLDAARALLLVLIVCYLDLGCLGCLHPDDLAA